MELELLELTVGIQEGIGVVEAGQVSDGDHVVGHAVDETATETVALQGITHGVDDFTRLDTRLGELPHFLDSQLEAGRVAAQVEPEVLDEVLGQASSRALTEDRHAGVQVGAGFVVGLLLAFGVDALVAGTHSDDHVVLVEDLHAGEAPEQIDPVLLHQVGHPLIEPRHGDHVVAVVVEGRRSDGSLDAPRLGQEVDGLLLDLALQGGLLLEEVGDQLLERAWVHHGAGDPVRAGGRSLVDDGDHKIGELLALALVVVRLDQVGEMEGARQGRDTATHEQNIDIKDVSLFSHRLILL